MNGEQELLSNSYEKTGGGESIPEALRCKQFSTEMLRFRTGSFAMVDESVSAWVEVTEVKQVPRPCLELLLYGTLLYVTRFCSSKSSLNSGLLFWI